MLSLSRRTLAAAVALGTVAGGMLVAAPAIALDPRPGDFATWHEYPTATPGGTLATIATDAADNIWYSDPLDNQIVRVPSASPSTPRSYDLGAGWPGVSSLAVGADGSIWFDDFVNGAIGHLDPVTGVVESFPLFAATDWASSLVAGPEGSVWFGDPVNGRIDAISPSGSITGIPEPSGAAIVDLVAAADGRLWYTKNTGPELGSYDPRTGTFESYPVPVGEFTGLALSNTGDLWVAGIDTLLRVRLDGSIAASVALPPSPAGYTAPRHLIAGVDTELHFTDYAMGIGTVDSAGHVRYTRPPFTDSAPDRLAVTSYGSLWYTDAVRNTLGNV
ncbi:hypothetical protein VD659_11885 [Herbiconiux sp. 11R-BC]|uniref:Vgb family protein n=1 Tax=Herbiconiux sp. 11R-BC TaxID=3111637 RepID=UPI003BFDD50F